MLKLLTPNGCQSYRVGDTMAITWRIDSVKTSMQIFFSGDGNRFSLTIGNVGATMPNYREGPFLWVIPVFVVSQDGFDTIRTVSDSCVVTVRDYNISRITDGSDRAFSISAR